MPTFGPVSPSNPTMPSGTHRFPPAYLHRISVVLHRPQSAGNIGSVARAMKNMGLSELILVAPETDLDKEAYWMACSARDLLERRTTVETIPEAIEKAALVIGTTARRGKQRFPFYSPREVAQRILSTARQKRVALLFGPEDSGLDNDALDLCHLLVTIPTSPEFSSLNLSQAVLLLAHEIFLAAEAEHASPKHRLSDTQEIERMYKDLEQTLTEIGFIHDSNPRHIMTAIRRLLGRSGLFKREVRIIRGICRQARWYNRQVRRPDSLV